MSSADLSVSGGRILLNGELRSLTLGITDGTVSHLVEDDTDLAAEETLALDGEVVLPGLVDGHVHFREPGYTEKEGIESGTAAAAAGGVTTIVEMPNTIPPVLDTERLEEKEKLFAEKSRIDFALFGAITDENVGTGDISALAEAGVTAFKTFMATSFGPLLMDDKGELFEAFEEVAATGLPLYIHAEDEEYLDLFRERARDEHGTDIAAFFSSRPPIAETTAVSDVLDIVDETGTETVIAHTTTAKALDRVATAREDGLPVHAEVTPYHLVFDEAALRQIGTRGLGTPPARDAANREALWERLRADEVHLVGSDHAPHLLEEKNRAPLEAAPGMPQLETALPSLLDAVASGKLTFGEIGKLYAERPARLHGLYPRKGSLQIGADADFVVVRPDEKWSVDADAFESSGSYSPFDGKTLRGNIYRTYQRGKLIAEEMNTLVQPGQGRQLTPE